MMNDMFLEHLVPKKKDTKDKLLIALMIFGGLVVSLILIMLMFSLSFSMAAARNGSSMFLSIGLLLVAGLWYLVYIGISSRNIEYEYTVTNNELDIDKVMSKRGRKHLVTVDVKEIACMGRIDDDEINGVYKNPPEGVKVLNYSAMSQHSSTYFIDCRVDEKHAIVLCQLTQKMIDALWRYNPKAIKNYRR